MPLYDLLRKCNGSYRLTKSKEKINHLMYTDNIAANEKELETLVQTIRIYRQNIGVEFGNK